MGFINSKRVQRSIRWFAAAAVLAAMATVHAAMPATSRAERGDVFIPQPDHVKLAALGFDAVLADFYWLWAVQIVGSTNNDPSQYSLELGRLIDVVTTLDPWVDHPYRFAAVWLIDSEQSVRTANRLLERGIQYHPDDWRNRYHLGFNHFFFLQEHAEAAQAIEPAIHLPGAPAYLPKLVARLRSESADLAAATLFLSQIVAEASDPGAKSYYEAALDEIEVERAARALDDARQLYQERHGRDIQHVSDLVAGRSPILAALPSAEPRSLPQSLRLGAGAVWQLDEESGRIESSHYGRRYELSFHPLDRKRNEEWQKRREQATAKEARGV